MCPVTPHMFFKTKNQAKSPNCWNTRERAPQTSMEKWSNVWNSKEKIPPQICDIILPTALIQTKQGCVWFSFRRPHPPHPLPPLFSLFLSWEKVGGGSERWQSSRRSLEVCPIPALNWAPQLLWLETGLVSVSIISSRHPGPHFLLISSRWLFALQPSPVEVLENPARGIYQRIMSRSSSCSLFT